MQHFMDTVETVAEGAGFSHFGGLHLIWLALFLLIVVINCIWYRRLSERGQSIWKKTVAILLLADELFKTVILVAGGRYLPDYLPLHLCSINIFLITIHAWKPSRVLSGYLYTVGIPGAMAALLFPTWTSLPLANFMHLHSFTVHILLALYPIVLGFAGELAPRVRELPRYLLLLVVMAIPIWGINIWLETNFMFLIYAEPGNPLYLFYELWGNHLYGFPVLIVAVLIVMYVPLVVFRRIRNKLNNK